MDPSFFPAISLIATGDSVGLSALLHRSPGLATQRSSCGHPTLLQLVVLEASNLKAPLDLARVLIQAGADLAEPIVAAASVDAREMLRLLLRHGAPVDGLADWTPLDEAIYWSHAELVDELLGLGANVRSLRAAAGVGDLGRVERYFSSGALGDLAGPIRSPFPESVPATRANAPREIVDNAFVTAVGMGHKHVGQYLLQQGARINSRPAGFHWKGTALHAAVWRGRTDLVKWLMESGADPSVVDGLADSDAIGWARHHGHPHLIPILTRTDAGT